MKANVVTEISNNLGKMMEADLMKHIKGNSKTTIDKANIIIKTISNFFKEMLNKLNQGLATKE